MDKQNEDQAQSLKTSQNPRVPREEKNKFILITAIVFIIAEIGRFSSMGWGFFITPAFAALFLAGCGCFAVLVDKMRIDYAAYAVACVSYILWGYTWIDIPDYGGPSSLLLNVTGMPSEIVSRFNWVFIGVCVVSEIFMICRTCIKNRPRKDLGRPYDKNRNVILYSVLGVAGVFLLVTAIAAIINHAYGAILAVAAMELFFVGGGVFYANIKRKTTLDNCLFIGLCLVTILTFVGEFLIGSPNGTTSLIGVNLYLGGSPSMIVLMILLMLRRRDDKRS